MQKLGAFDKVVLFGDNIKYPQRDDFMDDRDIKAVSARVAAKKPVLFIANTAKNYLMDSQAGTQILLIGHTHCGRKASVLLNNIEIYIDIFPADIIYGNIGTSISSDPKISDITIEDLLYDKDFIAKSDIEKLSILEGYSVFKDFVKEVTLFCELNKITHKAPVYKYIFELGIKPRYLGFRLFFKSLKAQREAVSKYKGKQVGALTNRKFFVTSFSSKANNFVDTTAARYDIHIGSWAKLQAYECPNRTVTKCQYNFVVDIKNYQQIKESEFDDLGITAESLNVCRSLYCAIDIETANTTKNEDLKAESNNKNILSTDNEIFNIGCVFCLETSQASEMFCVNIINTHAPNSVIRQHYKEFYIPGSFTIVTYNTRDTLMAFVRLIHNTRPDFMPGFNSLDFDLPQLLLSLRVNNLFDDFYSMASVMNSDDMSNFRYVYRYNGCEYRHNSGGYTYWTNAKTTSQVSGLSGTHKHEDKKLFINNGKLPEIKIKPQEEKDYHDIAIPGIIMLDVMIIAWKKDVKKATKGGGLNFYLKEYGFDPKLDIPYYKIWIYFGLTKTHDITVKASKRLGQCVHGFNCKHSYVDERDGQTYQCSGYKQYMLGNKPISRDIFKIMGDMTLLEHIRYVAVYCSYDAKGSMLLLKKFNFMEEKRKYCVYVNMIPHKVIYLADMNKAENGLRKTIQENNYVFIEEKFPISSEGDNRSDVKRLLAANPALERYHANHKAPKNKGGHVEIKSRGKISDVFEIPASIIDACKTIGFDVFKWLDDNKIQYTKSSYEDLGSDNLDGILITLAMPVEGIDFASLYPNLIMAFNLCKTKITIFIEEIRRMQKLDPTIEYTTIPVSEILADSDIPEQICEYYQKIFGVKDFASENIYIIKHNNDPAKYGILPKFMSSFFSKRKEAKGYESRATNFRDETFELHLDDEEPRRLYEEPQNKSKYKSFKDFLHAYLFEEDEIYRNFAIEIINQNGRQLAIKITMNSTYGTLDTIHSTFYSSIVAMLITFLGRRFIKLSGQYCTDNACTVVYHDTDSTYFHHNKSLFEDIVFRFVRGEISKKDLQRKFVMRSIKATSNRYQLKTHYEKKIKELPESKSAERIACLKAKLANLPDKTFIDKLNDVFAEKSGTRFLEQVREETLYPALYFMLKKYFGVMHTDKFNPNPAFKDLLFRGIKIRAGNCTDYLKQFIERVIWRIIDEDDTRKIIFDEIDYELGRKPDYNNITLYENTARYKSETKNSVAGLVARMNTKRDTIIDPKLRDLHRAPFQLEPILYINTKQKEYYDITGKKIKLNKQQLAEYSRVVEYLYRKHLATGSDYYEINMQDYVMSTIATCAQFLSFDPGFEGYREDIEAKDYVAIIKKHLIKYCNEYYSSLPATITIEEERMRYRKFLSQNKTLFSDMIAMIVMTVLPVNHAIDDSSNIIAGIRTYASRMLERMINVDKAITFGQKLKNIAICGYECIGRFNEVYFPSKELAAITGSGIFTRDDINGFRNTLLEYEKALDGVLPWLESIRGNIIPKMFIITKELANRYYSDEMTNLVLPTSLVSFLSEDDIIGLAQSELLFQSYCGWMAFTTGTLKNYYSNIDIYVPDI